jgi:hypothetical protein
VSRHQHVDICGVAGGKVFVFVFFRGRRARLPDLRRQSAEIACSRAHPAVVVGGFPVALPLVSQLVVSTKNKHQTKQKESRFLRR